MAGSRSVCVRAFSAGASLPLFKRFGTFFAYLSVFVPGLALAQAQMATPGSFAVSPSGASTYSIPIQIPPGSAGMQPNLSLNYSSQARNPNSMLGVGWSVGGFSVVHRCSANFTTDGAVAARGVNYNFNDKFCLDGQRLVVVGGSYGAAGSEYRTERDSFTRIVAQGAAGNGPAYFVAYTKSGQIMYYGDSSDSRIMPIIGGAIGSTPRVWALRAVFDRFNNYTMFSYSQDTTNGAYYPTSISYTGNTSTGTAAYNCIQFQYEARSDVVNQYVGAAKVAFTQRLASVSTYANTSTLVRSYRLIYQTAR